MERTNSGWRRMVPAAGLIAPEINTDDVEKIELFRIARNAAEALRLSPGQRAILAQLIGCYGGEAYYGRMLVWPSNELLERYTGISERSIRYIAASLIRLELISTKDSANGKRFAIHSKSGQIVDAFGFDLSPLLARRQEFADAVERLKTEREIRRRSFDAITVCRRSVCEILATMSEWFPETPTDDLETRYDRLCAVTPRRASTASPDAALADWQALRTEAESRYSAASGGSNRRLIDNTNDSPDQSCNNGLGGNDGATPNPSLVDLAAACPDAFAFAGKIETMEDLVREAQRLVGGTLRANQTAWADSCAAIGRGGTAIAGFLVLQRYAQQPEAVRNPGGYFRAYTRLLAEGKANLADDIRAQKRKRAH